MLLLHCRLVRKVYIIAAASFVATVFPSVMFGGHRDID